MPDRRAELEGIKATLLAKIAESRGQAFSLAVENLEHFLMATGMSKAMPLEILRGFGSFKDAVTQLKERMALEIMRIVIGLIERGDGSEALVESEESRRFTMTFTADVMSDLYWAVGTSSIRAIPDLYVTLRKGDADIRGGIQFIWWDLYDWNESVTPLDGKWWPPTLAGGWLKFGTTYGDLREMNDLGIARNYSLRTDWWTYIFLRQEFQETVDVLLIGSPMELHRHLDAIETVLAVEGPPRGIVEDRMAHIIRRLGDPRDWLDWRE